jgi:hypothetical protein
VDDTTAARRQAYLGQLADLLGRVLTPDEVAMARVMLAGPVSRAADPARQATFLLTEFRAWTAARAGADVTANPYGEPDGQLRTIWAAAFARAQTDQARARHAAATTPTSRTVRFFSGRDGRTIGTVTLTPAGELEYSNDGVRGMVASRLALGAERAFLSYTNWSNGYLASSEI